MQLTAAVRHRGSFCWSYLVPEELRTDRQTDRHMNGPSRCSSLTVKRKERLKASEITTVIYNNRRFFSSSDMQDVC